MSHSMNPLVYHIVSGHAFFFGMALLLAGSLAAFSRNRLILRSRTLMMIIGILLVSVSSTPLPVWFKVTAAAIVSGWIATRFCRRTSRSGVAADVPQGPVANLPIQEPDLLNTPQQVNNRRAWPVKLFAVMCIAGIVHEALWMSLPKLAPAKSRTLTIVGDSVTAGVGGDETSVTWPELLANEHRLTVQNLSHIGETAASALDRIEDIPIDSSVVLVEIGGNDVLGSTTPEEFEDDLNRLLEFLQHPNRQVVMFALPLPPFHDRWTEIQRNAATKHGTLLVPKRVFLSVIAGNESTLDTIHLSQAGHQRMADTVWGIVRTAFD
ncbi:MAG: GDSL-type esterase/lipase family protein [Planctomycetaceae bacterium]